MTEPLSAPAVGSIWMHYDGAVYRVEEIGNAEGTKPAYPPTVWYRNVINGKPYNRKVSDWHRSMTLVGEDGKDAVRTLAGALMLYKGTVETQKKRIEGNETEIAVFNRLYTNAEDQHVERVALVQLWRLLGVKDQTAACDRIRRLTEDEL